MEGMGDIRGVIVAAGVRESGTCAAAALMDVKAKEAGIAVRQACDVHRYQNGMFPLIELDLTPEVRGLFAAPDMGDGVGSGWIHSNTSPYYMP